jgi:hypothetical protein
MAVKRWLGSTITDLLRGKKNVTDVDIYVNCPCSSPCGFPNLLNVEIGRLKDWHHQRIRIVTACQVRRFKFFQDGVAKIPPVYAWIPFCGGDRAVLKISYSGVEL